MIKAKRKSKKTHVLGILNTAPVDVAALRKCAISAGGLISNEIRCRAWPYLLDVIDMPPGEVTSDPESHEDHRQVVLDVNRCGGRFPPDIAESDKVKLQEELTKLIISVLTKHPQLHYYQGYHDICITFLFVCGLNQALPLLEKLSTHHLRDFMDPTMNKTSHILNYLIPILKKSNEDLVEFMLKAEVGMVFAISWLITWYSYVLQNQNDMERLYDFFLACHPLMPIYFAAQVVLYNAEEVMACECEMPYVYQTLLRSARKPDLPLEKLISQASDFYIQFPPSCFAQQASEYFKQNLAMSTFSDYMLVAHHENPDVVLQRLGYASTSEGNNTSKTKSGNSNFVSRWGTIKAFGVAASGALGAIVIAASGRILEWGPDLF